MLRHTSVVLWLCCACLSSCEGGPNGPLTCEPLDEPPYVVFCERTFDGGPSRSIQAGFPPPVKDLRCETSVDAAGQVHYTLKGTKCHDSSADDDPTFVYVSCPWPEREPAEAGSLCGR